jgi:K+-sensing histidine kinase KdpD
VDVTTMRRPARPTPASRRRTRLGVAATGALAVAATVLLLAPHSGGAVVTTTPAIVFLLIVLATALAGGRTAGALVAVPALLAHLYYFVPPTRELDIADQRSAVGLIVFAFAEAIVCIVGGAQSDARVRAEHAGEQAARLQRFTASLSRAVTTQAV